MLTEKFVQSFSTLLPVEFGENIRKNTRAAVRSALDRMDLVTREELEVQQKVLQRTREKVERLERKVAELEQQLIGGRPD